MLLDDERERRRLGTAARTAVAAGLGREACGGATVAAWRPHGERPTASPVHDQSCPAHRVGAFAALRGRQDVLFAGRRKVRHGGGGAGAAGLPFPHEHVAQRDIGLARDGGFRAVVAGLSGRIALPAAPPRRPRAGVPFMLWRPSPVTAHGRPRRLLSPPAPPLSRRRRDRHLRAARERLRPHQGALGPVLEAPQAARRRVLVGRCAVPRRQHPYQVLFVGRLAGEKGLGVLIRAWRASSYQSPAPRWFWSAEGGSGPRPSPPRGAPRRAPAGLRSSATSTPASDVVVVPSISTTTSSSRGAWSSTRPSTRAAVIATDAVGASAGLVQEQAQRARRPGGRRRCARRGDRSPPRRRGAARASRCAGARGRCPYTQAAWAEGVSRALASVGASRSLPTVP